MPHFTLPLSLGGPELTAAVLVSTAREQMLQQLGQPTPPPQMIRALIDTGASISAVEPSVFTALGLTPTGEIEIHTPSTGGIAVKTPTYDVRVGIPSARPGDLHFISDTVQIIASSLAVQGIQALIGRDILSHCTMFYNGADGFFTLSY
jgi:predicted aspartyl protease